MHLLHQSRNVFCVAFPCAGHQQQWDKDEGEDGGAEAMQGLKDLAVEAGEGFWEHPKVKDRPWRMPSHLYPLFQAMGIQDPATFEYGLPENKYA